MKRPISWTCGNASWLPMIKNEGNREEISPSGSKSPLGMVKKLLQQRRQTGGIACRYR